MLWALLAVCQNRPNLYCSKDFCGGNAGIAHAPQVQRPSRPILFGLARHGRRGWVFNLDPTIAAAWPIRRPKPLRHYAFAAERAGLFVDDRAVDFEMPIERNAWSRSAQQSLESGFTNLDRLAPQILAIKLKQVESAETYGAVVLPPADHFKYGEATLVAGDGLAIDHARTRRQGRYGRGSEESGRLKS